MADAIVSDGHLLSACGHSIGRLFTCLCPVDVANNMVLGVNGTCANGGGLDGSDKDQRINGSHYYVSLETCGGHAVGSTGWQLPPCSTTLPPSLSMIDGYFSPDCVSRPSCAAAPFNNSVVCNVVLPPVGGALWSGPSEPVPANVTDNFFGGDPHFASADPYAALDWTLALDSPVWAIGFSRLPQEDWGPSWLNLLEGGWRSVVRALVPWAACPTLSTTRAQHMPSGCTVNASISSRHMWERLAGVLHSDQSDP